MAAAAGDRVEEDVDDNDEDCQRLVDEFVAVTDTNDALAQMFLQQRKWKLLPAINDYFEQMTGQPVPFKSLTSSSPAKIIELDSGSENDADDEDYTPLKKKAKSENGDMEPPAGSAAAETRLPVSGRKELIFVTWNTDGISEKNLTVRTEAVAKIVKQIQPDVLFLQEVVPESESILRERLTDYTVFSGQMWKDFPAQYYTLTLIRKETVRLISNHVVDFDLSLMTRNVIQTKVSCNDIVLNLLNTHLESTKDYASQRMQQLKQIKSLVKGLPRSEPVIVAGDLNVRDKELEEAGGLPSGWIDVWEATGRRPEVRYTWDTLRNDNLDTNFGRFKPRCRFDRILLCDSNPSKLIPKSFNLIGIERLKPHVCFPSDHWGILTVFDTFGVVPTDAVVSDGQSC